MRFDVDTAASGPATFVLSVARGGSTLLSRVVQQLAEAGAHPVVVVDAAFFDANVEESEYSNDPALSDLLAPGNTYTCFRVMPSALAWSPLFVSGPKILLVRDPRDVLVSRYFSDGWSHRLPPPGSGADELTRSMLTQRAQARSLSIDEFVLRRARSLRDHLVGYVPLLHAPTVQVLRYEDYIFDKRGLIEVVCRHFDWRADERTVAEILAWADTMPDREDPGAHVRQARPGDHRAKLAPETVAGLDAVLADVMAAFGYGA